MSGLPQADFGERVTDATYVPRPSAYAVIVREGAVLLVQGSNGGWFFPGGGLEAGESRAAALAREIFEETGRSAAVAAPFAQAVQHVYSHGERTHFELQATYHAATIEQAEGASGEHPSEWVAAEAALSRLHRDADRWALEIYLRR